MPSLCPASTDTTRRNRLRKPCPASTTHYVPQQVNKGNTPSTSATSSIVLGQSGERSPTAHSDITQAISDCRNVLPLHPCLTSPNRVSISASSPDAGSVADSNMILPSVLTRFSPGGRNSSAPVCTSLEKSGPSKPSTLPVLSLFKRKENIKPPSYIPWSQREPQRSEATKQLRDLPVRPIHSAKMSSGAESMKSHAVAQPSLRQPPRTEAPSGFQLQPSKQFGLLRGLKRTCSVPKYTPRNSFLGLRIPQKPKQRRYEIKHPHEIDKQSKTPSRPPRSPSQQAAFPAKELPSEQGRNHTDHPVLAPTTPSVCGDFENLPEDVPHPSDSNPSLESYVTSSSSKLAKQSRNDQRCYSLEAQQLEAARVAKHRRRAYHALEGETRHCVKRPSASERQVAKHLEIPQPLIGVQEKGTINVPSSTEADLRTCAEREQVESGGHHKRLGSSWSRLDVVPEEAVDFAPSLKQNHTDLTPWPSKHCKTPAIDPGTNSRRESAEKGSAPVIEKPLPPLPTSSWFPPRSTSLDQQRASSSVAAAHFPPTSAFPNPAFEPEDYNRAVTFKTLIDEETTKRKLQDAEFRTAQERRAKYNHHRRRLENGRSQLSSLYQSVEQIQKDVVPAASCTASTQVSPLSTKSRSDSYDETETRPTISPQAEAFDSGRKLITEKCESEHTRKGRHRFSLWEKEYDDFEKRKAQVLANEPSSSADDGLKSVQQQRDGLTSSTSRREDLKSDHISVTEPANLEPAPLRIPRKSSKRSFQGGVKSFHSAYSPQYPVHYQQLQREIQQQHSFPEHSPSMLSLSQSLRHSISNESLASWRNACSASTYSRPSTGSWSLSTPPQSPERNQQVEMETISKNKLDDRDEIIHGLSVPNSTKAIYRQCKQQSTGGQDNEESEIIDLYSSPLTPCQTKQVAQVDAATTLRELDDLLLETQRIKRDVRIDDEAEEARVDAEWEEVVREKVRKIESMLRIKRKLGAFE